MALVFTLRVDDPDTTNATGYTCPAFTPNADAGFVLGILSSHSSAPPTPTLDTPTWLTGAGWTQEAVIQHPTVNEKMTVYSGRTVSAPGSDDITATHASAVSGCHMQGVDITDEDGTDFVIQVKTGSSSATTGVSATFDAALGSASNANLAFVAHDVNEVHNPSGSETELADSGHGAPNRRLSTQYEINDATSGAGWANIAGNGLIVMLEIKQAAAGGPVTAEPTAGVVTLSGLAAAARLVARPAQAVLTLLGLAPTGRVRATPSPGGLTLAGLAPAPRVVASPTPGVLTLTGLPPTIGGEPPPLVATPSAGVLTLAGLAPTPTVRAAPTPGALTAAGLAPTATLRATPSPALLTLTGVSPTATVRASPAAATVTLLALAPIATVTARPTPGTLTLLGLPASFTGDIPAATRITAVGVRMNVGATAGTRMSASTSAGVRMNVGAAAGVRDPE